MTADHYERRLEPTPESLGFHGVDWSKVPHEEKVRYIAWVDSLESLPIETRFSLLVWILRSVVAPKEHYGKDADSKPEEMLSLVDWIFDVTGLPVSALFGHTDPPGIENIQKLKAPITIPKVD